jgi:hypothetical protein
MVTGINLCQQSHHLTPCLRVHREEVDDVGPVVASLVAVAHQARGDRVPVGLVMDQDPAERREQIRLAAIS